MDKEEKWQKKVHFHKANVSVGWLVGAVDSGGHWTIRKNGKKVHFHKANVSDGWLFVGAPFLQFPVKYFYFHLPPQNLSG